MNWTRIFSERGLVYFSFIDRYIYLNVAVEK
jgi:hypothetical protein